MAFKNQLQTESLYHYHLYFNSASNYIIVNVNAAIHFHSIWKPMQTAIEIIAYSYIHFCSWLCCSAETCHAIVGIFCLSSNNKKMKLHLYALHSILVSFVWLSLEPQFICDENTLQNERWNVWVLAGAQSFSLSIGKNFQESEKENIKNIMQNVWQSISQFTQCTNKWLRLIDVTDLIIVENIFVHFIRMAFDSMSQNARRKRKFNQIDIVFLFRR